MCHPLQSAIIWKREFPQPHVLIFFLIPFSFSIISTVSRGKVFKGDPKKSWFRYIQCLVSDLALIGHSNFVGFFSEYFFHCFEFFIFIFFSFQTAIDVQTRNSFKTWPLNLWWISYKTIVEVGNVTKATTFKSFFSPKL